MKQRSREAEFGVVFLFEMFFSLNLVLAFRIAGLEPEARGQFTSSGTVMSLLVLSASCVALRSDVAA